MSLDVSLGLDEHKRLKLTLRMKFTMMKKTKVILLIACVTFLGSCEYINGYFDYTTGGQNKVFAGRSEIKIVAKNKSFSPDEIIAKPGQVLKLLVSNKTSDQPIVFSVLKRGEDPIVNAFLGLQEGEANNFGSAV